MVKLQCVLLESKPLDHILTGTAIL
uniref:Uncharacterized protein n=1 Tax=Anguilla anguilla TaxID=7936 RepID=A0A0E9SHG6_ANGAN